MSKADDRTEVKARILGVIKEATNFHAMGEVGAAVKLLESLLREFPKEPSVHLYLAWYQRESGRYAEAIEHAKQAVQELPQSSRASLVLFHTLWKAERKEEAIEEIRRFLPIRTTAKHTSHYRDILTKWDAGDHGQGTYFDKGDSAEWLLQ